MIKYISLFVLITSIGACSFFDSFDETPMFVTIPQANIVDNSSQKVSDVWAFADGFSIGNFEIPETFPVLGEGQVTLNLFPGIRNNGIQSAPIQYPFFKGNEHILDFKPGETVSLDLEVEYLDNVKFSISEDFEGNHILNTDNDNDPITKFVSSTEAKFGDFCGKITLTADNNVFSQSTDFIRPTDELSNSDVFLELDYRSDVVFQVGIVGFIGNLPTFQNIILLREREEWDKLYLEIGSILSIGGFDGYQILFTSFPDTGAGSVWVDNIKVVYLEQ